MSPFRSSLNDSMHHPAVHSKAASTKTMRALSPAKMNHWYIEAALLSALALAFALAGGAA